MWQHHFEFLLLGYGAYLTFAEFCQRGAAGHPRPAHLADGRRGGRDLFRPDEELRRLARLAIETDVAGAFQEGRSPDEIEAELGKTDAGKRWLEELEAIKDPWFNMGDRRRPLPLLRQLERRPADPVRVADRPHLGAPGRRARSTARPSEVDRRARPDRRRVRGAARRGGPADVRGAAGPLAQGLPLRRGAQVLLRLLVPVALLQQGPRVRLGARRAWLPRGRRGRLPARSPRGPRGARGARPAPGRPAGSRWGRIAGRRSSQRRKELLRKLEEWNPPPALGAMPEAVNDPMVVMLWGVTKERLQSWARPQDGGGAELARLRGLAGRGRGHRPGWCAPWTSSTRCKPARSWSARSRLRPGRRSSARSRRPSPTSAGSCPTQRSSPANTVCRPSSARAPRPRRSRPASGIKVDGSTGAVRILDGERGVADGPARSPTCGAPTRSASARRAPASAS